MKKIGMGGGCHWCTEAVFEQLEGVFKVEQGYIASVQENSAFSEAVIVHYDPEIISLKALIKVHLHTHASTSTHSFRKKYRSAVYCFEIKEIEQVDYLISDLQSYFKSKIITEALLFSRFKSSRESLLGYYKNNKNAPFCQRYIVPKLEKVKNGFDNTGQI